MGDETSIASLFMMALSILRMAVLMVLGGGRAVKPMFITFDRFGSKTASSFLLVSWFLKHL